MPTLVFHYMEATFHLFIFWQGTAQSAFKRKCPTVNLRLDSAFLQPLLLLFNGISWDNATTHKSRLFKWNQFYTLKIKILKDNAACHCWESTHFCLYKVCPARNTWGNMIYSMFSHQNQIQNSTLKVKKGCRFI